MLIKLMISSNLMVIPLGMLVMVLIIMELSVSYTYYCFAHKEESDYNVIERIMFRDIVTFFVSWMVGCAVILASTFFAFTWMYQHVGKYMLTQPHSISQTLLYNKDVQDILKIYEEMNVSCQTMTCHPSNVLMIQEAKDCFTHR